MVPSHSFIHCGLLFLRALTQEIIQGTRSNVEVQMKGGAENSSLGFWARDKLLPQESILHGFVGQVSPIYLSQIHNDDEGIKPYPRFDGDPLFAFEFAFPIRTRLDITLGGFHGLTTCSFLPPFASTPHEDGRF